MRILHITNTLQEGGVETFLYTLLPEIKQAGHEVEVLVLTKDKNVLAEQFEKKGVKVHKGKFRWVYNPLNIFVIWYYIQSYDIVHVHLFPTQYFTAVAHLFSLNCVKIITTEHSVHNKRRTYRWLQILERWVYRQCDRIVAVSEGAKIALDRWALTEKKTLVIYNGILLDDFYKSKAYDRKTLGVSPDDKIVMMIARFYLPKDHVTPIKALRYLPSHVHLMYVGSGDTLESYKQLAESLKVHSRVHFLGKRSDIPELAKMCDIGILASEYEGFGISALEIMAVGKPVVVSDIDGLRELVKDYGVLFSNYDERDLASKIGKLLNDELYYNDVAQKCYKRSDYFSSTKMIKKYLELYQI